MSNMAANILIIEDEDAIRRFVRQALEREGYRVFDAENMASGLIETATRKPDLIVLDLGLPDGNGVDFIRDLRQWSAISILVLSARSDEQDKIDALDAGADDYLTKPFGIGELLARVRVALRHPLRGEEKPSTISFAAINVDLVNRQVTRDGELLHLTPIEFRLLATLLSYQGKVVTQRQLL